MLWTIYHIQGNILNTLHGCFTWSSQVGSVIIPSLQMRKLKGGVIYSNLKAS